MTAGQVADALGINRRTVWRIARDHEIGQVVNARVRLFSAADAERIGQLTHRKRGRPPGSSRPRPDDGGSE